MSVIYKGQTLYSNAKISDFLKKDIFLTMLLKWVDYKGLHHIRGVFRSNGLLGEIRTTCYGDTFAVDVKWGWRSNECQCLTTECKTIQEAKNILLTWFHNEGFKKTDEYLSKDWSLATMKFNKPLQLKLIN